MAVCSQCGKRIGLFSKRYKFGTDSVICKRCFEKSSIEDEEQNKWNKESILQFLLDTFGELDEDSFDDFEDYVKHRKGKMDIDQNIKILLKESRNEIEEGIFDDFEDYVQFRRAIKNLGYD